MDQAILERRLLRCRYLIIHAPGHRLGVRAAPQGHGERDALIRKFHRAYKRAAQILIDTTLELEADLTRAKQTGKDSAEAYKYRYWLALVGSCCEIFLTLAFRDCDIPHLYKGPRFGSLAEQNVESVLKAASEINESPYAFAFPLDFTRFSCTGDLLCIVHSPGDRRVAIVELKEGDVNDAIHEARKAQSPDAWFKFFDKYGTKGIQQAQRVFKQQKEFYKREARIRAKRGIHKDDDGTRVVLESETPLDDFVPIVERVCRKARKGEYAVEAIDGCLMIAAADATSKARALIAEADARLFVLNAFVAPGIAAESPKNIAAEMAKINVIDWFEGLGSVYFLPLLARPLRPRTFLDLAFGRVHLLYFFHPPGYVELLLKAGVKAELISRKETNRLRSVRGLRAGDLPLHDGQAIGFYIGQSKCYMGSIRLHQMVFNWARPHSMVAQLANGIASAPTITPAHPRSQGESSASSEMSPSEYKTVVPAEKAMKRQAHSNMTTKADKLGNFVRAFGAARVLIQKANEEGDLLEGLVLYAALTDGFLRIGLVLKRQLVKKTADVDELLISQEPNGQYYTERQIQRKALAESVIKQHMFDELGELYDKRNDAIHKFFLTGLQYSDLAPFLERYEVMYKSLNRIVYELEAEQIKKGVGMTASGSNTKEDTVTLLREIATKIDSKFAESVAIRPRTVPSGR